MSNYIFRKVNSGSPCEIIVAWLQYRTKLPLKNHKYTLVWQNVFDIIVMYTFTLFNLIVSII